MNQAPASGDASYPSIGKLRDVYSRSRKAGKIRVILEDTLGPRLENRSCLDVGCSAGLITHHLAILFATVVGVDPDLAAIRHASRQAIDDKPVYLVADAAHLPFQKGAFDVLVCAQVYEHVDDQRGLADELWRVLTDDGICFFSGPNRLALIEEHYGLPLLSWLPRLLANLYVRLSRRGERYEIRARTLWSLRHLLGKFRIRDYTVDILTEPDRFSCNEELGRLRLVSQLPRFMLRNLLFLVPNYNWVLDKNRD
jgi:2-polyprenyl-3-methyl-5-hydroxy-6-metoxy-1,4-benzoquinol methylase